MPKYIHISAPTAEISYLQSATDVNNLTTYTFSGQNLGTAASDRYIVVAMSQRGADNLSSVTIGGVAATIVAESTGTSNSSAIVIAAVPTGATGDIVVTWNTGSLRMGISVYRLTGLASATATDFQTSTASNPSVLLDFATNGVGVGVGLTQSSTATATWTGMTEDYDVNIESQISFSTASISVPAGETDRNIIITWTANSAPRACFASWA